MASSVFSLKYNRYDADAADARCEKAEEDVGRGDEPEGEDVDGLVAVVRLVAVLFVHQRLVDSIHPDTA